MNGRLTPGVDDWKGGQLRDPDRFNPGVRHVEFSQTSDGAVLRTDLTNEYAVDVRHFNGDGGCVWVFISGGPDDISTAEKMHPSQIAAYVRHVTGG